MTMWLWTFNHRRGTVYRRHVSRLDERSLELVDLLFHGKWAEVGHAHAEPFSKRAAGKARRAARRFAISRKESGVLWRRQDQHRRSP